MARGFLPVDTSGISQGISDAASGLGGWLSNAFTTPDSVVQSRQQHRDTWRGGPDAIAKAQGFYDADQKDIADRVYSNKFANALRSGLNTVLPIDDLDQNSFYPILLDEKHEKGWLPNLKTYNVPLAAELDFDMGPGKGGAESYDTLAHILMEADPRQSSRAMSKSYGWLDRALGGDRPEEIRIEDAVQEATRDILEQDIGKGPRPFVTTKGHPPLESLLEKVEKHPIYTDTLQSFFDIPEVTPIGTGGGVREPVFEGSPLGNIEQGGIADWFRPANLEPSGGDSLLEEPTNIDNINTLLMNTLVPISTGSGIGGIIEDGVQTDFAPRDVMPVVTGPEDFEPVMPDLSIPFDPANESELFGTFDSTTPGLIGDYLGAQEQEFILPSGPEEMTEVFTQEDKAAEDERKRIADIVAQAERDRFELERKAERLAWEARREQERAEKEARDKREEAAKAEDRQDKARLSREADERERQAQERQREIESERQQAVAAARLNALAAAAEQQNLAYQRRQREEEARKQAEFDRQHQRFMDQLIANNRNRGSYRGMQPGLAGPR